MPRGAKRPLRTSATATDMTNEWSVKRQKQHQPRYLLYCIVDCGRKSCEILIENYC